MKFVKRLSLPFIATLFLFSCVESNLSTPQSGQESSTPAEPALPVDSPPRLFNDAGESIGATQSASSAGRSRFVYINRDLLLGSDERILNLEPGTLVTINLFPDVNFTGVIERLEQNGPDSHSLVGHLQEIDYSSMYIVFTGGVFLMHFASPMGVYEVQQVQDDLYRVVQVDQAKSPKD